MRELTRMESYRIYAWNFFGLIGMGLMGWKGGVEGDVDNV